ncbi:class I SAM-dependent methyltransferase [Brevibacillus sp. MER 51]|uniref:class I SAM-dependent methyltransferase n=1 Tax=Brevibacillus sp. MER 51 TaxID=2939560 RepID=UPI00203AF1BC|nr:class I SAM-dependent methyltransferase [Brevibacillus sp. MER 51]MCM3144117.1 class I SAM-dependent methyltransferase [Brevibacillus sp. MER 51]
MENKDWIKSFQEEVEAPFAGWDFARLTATGRMRDAPLGWNYVNIVKKNMQGIRSMLEMGTGGGELFSKLAPFPQETFATEGYEPNVAVAKAKLEPLGVRVFPVDGEEILPFEDQSLDLIINRHEAYLPSEMKRLLKPGGTFVTQQVGGQDNLELNRLLGAPIPPDYLHWNLAYAVNELEESGLTIVEQKEEMSFSRFYDIGAIVYYLKAIEWQIRDFTVEKYAQALLDLHQKIEAVGYIDIPTHRFLVIAQQKS